MDTKIAKEEIRKNIIELFNINNLPEEKQEETITRIGKIIFQSVLLKVLPILSEEELAQYEKLLEENVDADVLLDFFFEKIPGFLEIIAEESENFRKDSEEILAEIK